MDPRNDSSHVPPTETADEGLGEHTGPTEATSAVEKLPGEFGDLDGTEGG